jgi:hypothetical protein
VEEHESEDVRQPVADDECRDEQPWRDESDARREEVGEGDVHQQVVPPGQG